MDKKLETQVREIFHLGADAKKKFGSTPYTLAFNPDITVNVNFSNQEELILSFFKEDVQTYINAVKALDLDNRFEHSLKTLKNLSSQILKKASHVESTLTNKLAAKQLKSWFIFIVSDVTFQSELMHRATLKPRGYPGDYLLLEKIYRNKPVSKSNLGKLFDNYFLMDPLAIAVRNRKDFMVSFLKQMVILKNSNCPRFLNLASGSCRDILEAFSDNFFSHNVEISCLDRDEEAVAFSRKTLAQLNKGLQLNFIVGNLFSFTRGLDPSDKYDLIYSIGLADYLPDLALEELIRFGLTHLKKGGKFVLAHKDYTRYLPLPENWFCNWNFYDRDVEYILKMIEKRLGNRKPKIQRDPSGIMFYLIFTK